jgi:hypothetical protein
LSAPPMDWFCSLVDLVSRSLFCRFFPLAQISVVFDFASATIRFQAALY